MTLRGRLDVVILLSSKIKTISTLDKLYITKVLMHAKAKQPCSKTINVCFNLKDAFTVTM